MKAHIDYTPVFKPGDPCPEGYIARQDWAQVQMDAGLKQAQCGNCSLWCFPQELSALTVSMTGNTRKDGRGRTVKITFPICKECAAKHPRLKEYPR